MVRKTGRLPVYCRRLVVLLLLIVSSSGYSEEGAALVIQPERVTRGNQFVVQIRTSIPWGEEVTIERPELFGPVAWWAYPYARPWTMDNGQSARMVEVMAAIKVEASGFHLLGPFRITSGDRTAITESREVIGLEPDEAEFPYPVVTLWRNAPVSFWQGQAVPVVMEARNLASLSLAETVALASAPPGLLEEAPGLGGIQTRPHGNDILFDVPMASWIWTIGAPGEHRFPGVKATVAGLVRTVPSFPVEVKPLPPAVQTSAAVGHFSLKVQWDEGPYFAGNTVSVRIRVEGEGNLNVLKTPVPELDGTGPVSQGSISSYVPSLSGYLGWREDRYDFQIDRTGDLSLKVPGWTWLEPEGNGRVRSTGGKSSTITAEKAAGDSGSRLSDLLLGAALFRYHQAAFHWNHQYWLLLALPGLIVFLVLFFVRKPGRRGLLSVLVIPLLLSASGTVPGNVEIAARAEKLADEGKWEESRTAYEGLLAETGESPGLLHDLAITELETGRADRAVALARRALYLRPGTGRFSETLEHIEGTLGLSDQVPVPLSLPVPLIFSAWLVAINLFFLALAMLMYRREARDVILFVSTLLLLAAASSFMAFSDRRWRDTTAVVRSDSSPLRKIPGPLATDWIQLPSGSAVSVEATEGDDFLVRTGYGLEGWMSRDSLIFIKEPVNGI